MTYFVFSFFTYFFKNIATNLLNQDNHKIEKQNHFSYVYGFTQSIQMEMTPKLSPDIR